MPSKRKTKWMIILAVWIPCLVISKNYILLKGNTMKNLLHLIKSGTIFCMKWHVWLIYRIVMHFHGDLIYSNDGTDAFEAVLDGLLADSWLLGNTCENVTAQDQLENNLPNQHNICWHGNHLNECHYLVTILIPLVESYQAIATYQQISATTNKRLLPCTVAKCTTIGAQASTKTLKYYFIQGQYGPWYIGLFYQKFTNASQKLNLWNSKHLVGK